MSAVSFENKLVEIGYSGLFMFDNEKLSDSIWKNGDNQTQLEDVVESSSSSLHAKFLAAEILRHHEVKFKTKNTENLVEAYTYALTHTSLEKNNSVQLNGNLWGLLYDHDDSGYLGKQLIAFGESGISHLTELLDQNGNITYEGSKEATMGNAYQYRVKDFAAFYISKIKNIHVKFYQDLDSRDQEINRLKKFLKSE